MSAPPLKAPTTWTDLEFLLIEYFNTRPDAPHRREIERVIWDGLTTSFVVGLTNEEEKEKEEEKKTKKTKSPLKVALLSQVIKDRLLGTPAGQALNRRDARPTTSLTSDLKQAYVEKRMDKVRQPVMANGKPVRQTILTPMFEGFVTGRNAGSPLTLQDYVRTSIDFFLKELRDDLYAGELRTTALEKEVQTCKDKGDAAGEQKALAKLEQHQKSLRDGSFYRQSPYVKKAAWAQLYADLLTQVFEARARGQEPAWKSLLVQARGFEHGNATEIRDAKQQLKKDLETWKDTGSGPDANALQEAQERYAQLNRALERQTGLFAHPAESVVGQAGNDGEEEAAPNDRLTDERPIWKDGYSASPEELLMLREKTQEEEARKQAPHATIQAHPRRAEIEAALKKLGLDMDSLPDWLDKK